MEDTDQYLKEYLGINNTPTNDCDFIHINKDDSYEKFQIALANFYNITKIPYYKDGVMFHGWNNYLLTFNYKFKELKSLYDYAENKNNRNACKFISDFLTSYYFSIESDNYKKDSKMNEKIQDAFFDIFEKREFYKDGKYLIESIEFCLDFVEQQEDYDFYDLQDKLYKLKYHKGKENYKKIIDNVLDKNEYISHIIEFDYDINSHKEIYNEYILKNITEFKVNGYLFDNILNLMEDMYSDNESKNILEEKVFIAVFNELIDEINEIIISFDKEIENAMVLIDNTNQLLKAFSILKKFYIYYDKYKNMFENCVQTLLCCKRRYLKGENANAGLATISKEFNIPENVIERLKNDLLESYQHIFNYLQVDFDHELENALKAYSSTPLIYHVQYANINPNQGTYSYWNDVNETKFSNYFNEKGKELTKSLSSELRNKYFGNFYYLMLRNLINTFIFNGNIVAGTVRSLSTNELESYICDLLLDGEKDVYLNDYVLCTYLILTLESVIYDQMGKAGLTFGPTKMFSNVEQLFDCYKNDDFSRNTYMLVNYVLYDEYGLKYRNNFMHGNFIHKKNLTVELLYIFACVLGLIIASQRNEKKV